MRSTEGLRRQALLLQPAASVLVLLDALLEHVGRSLQQGTRSRGDPQQPGPQEHDRDDQRAVGLQFLGVNVPAGATLVDAYVQFQADKATSVPTTTPARIRPSSIMSATSTIPFSRPRHALLTSSTSASCGKPAA